MDIRKFLKSALKKGKVALTKTDAIEMINEIRSQKLLGKFRSEAAVDRDRLIQTLMGLSKIGMDFSEIAEVDINPLLIAPDGTICAVDALVVIGKNDKEARFQLPVDPRWIGSLFYPESIAFVGASAQVGKWGNMLLSNTISNGLKGKAGKVKEKARRSFKGRAEQSRESGCIQPYRRLDLRYNGFQCHVQAGGDCKGGIPGRICSFFELLTLFYWLVF